MLLKNFYGIWAICIPHASRSKVHLYPRASWSKVHLYHLASRFKVHLYHLAGRFKVLLYPLPPPSEESLRQTSMLLRTEPHWKLVEPLKRIGGRIHKDFFLVNCETEAHGKQMLTWVIIDAHLANYRCSPG